MLLKLKVKLLKLSGKVSSSSRFILVIYSALISLSVQQFYGAVICFNLCLQYFAVRSLGWLQVEEDDLSPGRSSLAVSNVIQQLSHCSSPEQRDRSGAWGEVRVLCCHLWVRVCTSCTTM